DEPGRGGRGSDIGGWIVLDGKGLRNPLDPEKSRSDGLDRQSRGGRIGLPIPAAWTRLPAPLAPPRWPPSGRGHTVEPYTPWLLPSLIHGPLIFHIPWKVLPPTCRVAERALKTL